jgi:hypothetical protein
LTHCGLRTVSAEARRRRIDKKKIEMSLIFQIKTTHHE